MIMMKIMKDAGDMMEANVCMSNLRLEVRDQQSQLKKI